MCPNDWDITEINSKNLNIITNNLNIESVDSLRNIETTETIQKVALKAMQP